MATRAVEVSKERSPDNITTKKLNLRWVDGQRQYTRSVRQRMRRLRVQAFLFPRRLLDSLRNATRSLVAR